MDLFLIGLMIVLALALVLCLTYFFTLATAVVFMVMPEGIFTWLVSFYDGSPVASAVAIVRILIAITFVYYLLKYLADNDDGQVLRTTVVMSSIGSLLSSLFLILVVFKGGLDLAFGMAQVELHVLLALAIVEIWRRWVLPALIYIKVVWLLEKVADKLGDFMFWIEIHWEKNTYHFRQITVWIGVLLVISILLFAGTKVGEHISQTKVEEQKIQQMEFQSDLFQMQRGNEWCKIPLYGLSEREFLDFVPVDIIFKSCDIAENHEVVAFSNDWEVIYVRLPSNYKMEIGDISCRNSNQFFPEDCSTTGKYLWLQVGYIANK